MDGKRPRSTKKEGFSTQKGAGKLHRRTRFASKQEVIDIPGYGHGQNGSLGSEGGRGGRGGGGKSSRTSGGGAYLRGAGGGGGGGGGGGIGGAGGGGGAGKVPTYQEKSALLEKQFRRMLSEVRTDLKASPPIPIDDANPRQIKLKDINGTLTMSGLKMTGLHEFMINKVQVPTADELKAGNLWVKYELTVPHLHISGRYEAEGTHKKVDVKSSGDFEGDVLFYKNVGHVTFTQDEDGALQVQDYKLKIQSLGVDVMEKGLKFGILGSSELKPIIDKELHAYLQKYWKEISPKAAEKAKERLNAILRRLFKERQEDMIKNKEKDKTTEEARKLRDEEIRRCRERMANRPPSRPEGYPLSRDQSLLGWLHPPKHPMM